MVLQNLRSNHWINSIIVAIRNPPQYPSQLNEIGILFVSIQPNVFIPKGAFMNYFIKRFIGSLLILWRHNYSIACDKACQRDSKEYMSLLQPFQCNTRYFFPLGVKLLLWDSSGYVVVRFYIHEDIIRISEYFRNELPDALLRILLISTNAF